jgi:hypothetical protein
MGELQMSTYMSAHTALFITILGALLILNIILSIVLWQAFVRTKKMVRRFKSIHVTADLEAVYQNTLEAVEDMKKDVVRQQHIIDEMAELLSRKVSTARIMRYNAFSETGSDLSFSVALLDDHEDGVVVSSIYGREDSRVYAKPVEAGESTYPLTEEEAEVLSVVIGRPVRTRSRV